MKSYILIPLAALAIASFLLITGCENTSNSITDKPTIDEKYQGLYGISGDAGEQIIKVKANSLEYSIAKVNGTLPNVASEFGGKMKRDGQDAGDWSYLTNGGKIEGIVIYYTIPIGCESGSEGLLALFRAGVEICVEDQIIRGNIFSPSPAMDTINDNSKEIINENIDEYIYFPRID